MGNSDDDRSSRSDGRSSPSSYHRKGGSSRRNGRRRSNPNVSEHGPMRRPSNSNLNDLRSTRRPSAPCIPGGGMKPPIPPNVRDVSVRKRSGQLSRPMSKERLASEVYTPFEEDEMTCSLDSEVLRRDGERFSFGRSYSGSMDILDCDGRNTSSSNNNRLQAMTEQGRNSANLQMSHQSNCDNPLSSAEFGETSVKVVESSRSKQPKLESKARIQYDRNFLLQLQYEPESLQRPASLPSLPEILLEAPVGRNEKMSNSLSRKSFNDFTPNFPKSNPGYPIRSPDVAVPNPRMPVITSGASRSTPRRPSHSKEQQQQPPRKVIQVSLQANVQLHTAENAWKPVHKKEMGDASALNEELYRKVRGILNKLTPQKFQTLIQQVYDLNINTEKKLMGSIDLIFEKAISEPNFSVAYANMAKCLINLKVPTEYNPIETVTFRKLLLTRCQREFEKDKLEEIDLEHMQSLINSAETEEKRKLLIEAKEKAEMKSKKRSLGNIRFIGELYKLKMLTENIMHDCICRLLKHSHDEDNLECLSRLLMTIGQDIDNDKSRCQVDNYMHHLKEIIGARRISSRIKFMLQDLLELRENGWVPRHEDNKPKLIEQIHKEAEQEEQQKLVLLQRTSQEQRDRGGSYRRPRTPCLLSGSVSEEGWRGTLSNVVDPLRMKLTKHQVEDMQLGPGGRPGFLTWQRGSNGGGSRTPSQERERVPRHNDGYDHRNYSRTLPRGKGLAMRSMEKDRSAAIAAVRSIAAGNLGDSRNTPTNSRNASRDSSCSREASRGSHSSNELLPHGSNTFGRSLVTSGRYSTESSRNIGLGNGMSGAQDPGSIEVTTQSGDATGQRTKESNLMARQEMSPKEIEKRAKSILDEYLHINDLEEASQYVAELNSSKAVILFITAAINCALERSYDERRGLGCLLAFLVKKKRSTLDHLVAAFREILCYAEDMEIDVPKVWQYLGELIALMFMDGTVPVRLIRNFCENLPLEKSSLLVVVVLEILEKNLGREKLHIMWQESHLSLKEFMAQEKSEQQIRKENFAWLESNSIESSNDALWSELDKLSFKPKTENDEIITWIKTNVSSEAACQPPFIRALMSAICKSSLKGVGSDYRVDKEHLKSRGQLLTLYLNRNVGLEVQALYALQNVVYNLQFPQDILRIFFDTLYDEEIISEEAFDQWYNFDEPGDQVGKGVAKNSVVQFFTWLHDDEQ